MIECMSTDAGVVSVSNREYEQRIQDDISEIKTNASILPIEAFLEEFDKIDDNNMYSRLSLDDMKK